MKSEYDLIIQLLREEGFSKARVRGANQLLVYEAGKISLSFTRYNEVYYLMTWSPQAYVVPTPELITEICTAIKTEKYSHGYKLSDELVLRFGLKIVDNYDLLGELVEWQSVEMEAEKGD